MTGAHQGVFGGAKMYLYNPCLLVKTALPLPLTLLAPCYFSCLHAYDKIVQSKASCWLGVPF